MRIVCAWCGKEMGEKPGEGITHSICEECAEKEFGEKDRAGPKKEE